MPALRILIGEFGRAQGVRGEVRLVSHTADPRSIARYAPLESEDGQRLFEIAGLRRQGASLIAKVKGVDDRSAAEGLTRLKLYVPRARLSDAERGADEHFVADLVGLTAVKVDGAIVGEVVAASNYGAGDLLEIAPASGGETLLLPFAEPFVGEVDLAAGRVVVRPPREV